MKISRRSLVASLLIVQIFSTLPASGGADGAPQISDVAGDANGINSMGLSQLGDVPEVQSAPASLGAVDLLAVGFETTFTTTKLRNAEGKVTRVHHEPQSVVVRITTQDPPVAPSDTNISYTIPIVVDGVCAQGYILLSLQGQGATGQPLASNVTWFQCEFPRSDVALGSITIAGNVASLEFPLSVLQARGVGVGSTVAPREGVSGRVNATLRGRRIDEAKWTATSYTIGSDVPPGIDCLATPGHPECAG